MHAPFRVWQPSHNRDRMGDAASLDFRPTGAEGAPRVGIGDGPAPKPPEGQAALKEYLDRLLKLIPAEVIGIYLVGSSMIPKVAQDQLKPGKTDDVRIWGIGIWAIICLVLVIITRIVTTRDTSERVSPEWRSVWISAIAFVLWVYTMGGPFAEFDFYKRFAFIGPLSVMVWSYLIPLFYKGTPPK